MAFIDQILASEGRSRSDVPSQSALGKALRASGVGDSADFRRIKALPRRVWQRGVMAPPEVMADMLTRYLARPGGTMKLRPVQAACLTELHDFGGLFGIVRVGGGKTIVSLLAPRVLGSQRPLLLVPAKLKAKTLRERERLQKDWVLPEIRVESYELLSRVRGSTLLEEYAPDLLICDEAHRLKRPSAAVTRRVKRYLADHPSTVVAMLSGTITRKSLLDYWHLLRWALRDDGMPLPSHWPEVVAWSSCLDSSTAQRSAAGDAPRTVRMTPGVLLELCTEQEQEEARRDPARAVALARVGYQRRLTETPGVISTLDERIACSLSISQRFVDLDHLGGHFHRLRYDSETPDGHTWSEASELWRHARELTCGFFYVWWDHRAYLGYLRTARNSVPWSPAEAALLDVALSARAMDSDMVRAIEAVTFGGADMAPYDASVLPAIPAPALAPVRPGARYASWVRALSMYPNVYALLREAGTRARPPRAWMDARRRWTRFVRETLRHSRELDTELQVVRAITQCSRCGRNEGHHPWLECQTYRPRVNQVVVDPDDGKRRAVYDEWVALRPTYEPETVPRWLDDTTLEFAKAWMESNVGIVWVEHLAFAERLAHASGRPYYGQGGVDSRGRPIEDERESCIASISANCEGRNLQHFSRGLIVSCPPNGAILEQLLGRNHRDGQDADEVGFDLVLACREQWEGWNKALEESRYIEQSTGVVQKLLIADLDVLDAQDIAQMAGPLWSRRND